MSTDMVAVRGSWASRWLFMLAATGSVALSLFLMRYVAPIGILVVFAALLWK